ncbi:hypothetical protein OOJ09_25960 [Mesorhizobium qingshengii]|uniref:Transposase n=1 Tax=Mesorhizobium qingshengii TaxID=1165689 RepID=A0ABT4R1C7_9HYPH|nr:hypothetical protein [Mesorhizobium qingshengii]MCZ8547646.1 hypothetical protein [Mesorhizobium qingshengii]
MATRSETAPVKPPVYLKDIVDPAVVQAVEDALDALMARKADASLKK